MAEEFKLTDVEVEYYKPLVEKASQQLFSQSNFITIEDLQQDLWLWLTREGHRSFERLRYRREIDNSELTDNDIQALLIRKARSIAQEELIAYRNFTGDYLYQRDEVKNLVLDLFEDEGADIEGRLDVREAYEALAKISAIQYNAIRAYYYTKEDTSKTVGAAARRGILTLTALMNDGKYRKAVNVEEI